MLGLPGGVTACLFDMDGVVTKTAVVHAAAWKEMFDEFLREHAAAAGTPFVPFDPVADYDTYVDGKPRLDGTRSFLRARGIDVPEGTPDDPAGTPTVWGLSNRKNDLVLFHNRGVMHSVTGALKDDDLRVFHQCNLHGSDDPAPPSAEDIKMYA